MLAFARAPGQALVAGHGPGRPPHASGPIIYTVLGRQFFTRICGSVQENLRRDPSETPPGLCRFSL